MKPKVLIMLAFTLMLVFTTSVPAAASEGEAIVPFKASYNMSPRVVGVDSNGCNIQELPGVGKATHLGESTVYSDAVACPRTLTQSGDLLFTADNGDQLWGGFAGTMAFTFPSVHFWGDFWITGGSGRFEGVTGAGTYDGTAIVTPGGKGVFTMDGMLQK